MCEWLNTPSKWSRLRVMGGKIIADVGCRLSAPLSPEHRRRLVEALATWDFKPHRLDDGDLYRVATLLFEAILSSEGVAELQIPRG